MGYRIKEVRKSLKVSQEELAEKSGISRATISALENGFDRNAEIQTLLAIANALGCTLSDIFYADSK